MKNYICILIILSLYIAGCEENPTESSSIYFRISGRNMQYWQTELGESIAGPGENIVTIADIRTDHKYDHSEIKTNINNRNIQVQNINYYQKSDAKALNVKHNAAFIFSLQSKPESDNHDQNGDMIQAGLYITDGSVSNSEYAVAFRWIVNPWRTDYGKFYTWTGSNWQQRVTIPPDSLDHTVEITLDRMDQTASLSFDRYTWRDVWSKSGIDDNDNGVTASLELATTNAFNLENDNTPAFTINFKNWKWEWTF